MAIAVQDGIIVGAAYHSTLALNTSIQTAPTASTATIAKYGDLAEYLELKLAAVAAQEAKRRTHRNQ